MILLIDNYDSFVHNLSRSFRELGCDTAVVRNDAMTVEQILTRRYDAIIMSPGPCTPAQTGVCLPLLHALPLDVPVLGVCLGHQTIAAAFGGHVGPIEPMHGRASLVRHGGHGLFEGVPDPFAAGRYHSLAVHQPLPASLRLDAVTEDGIVMAISHQSRPIYGVQFHPESILTESGQLILANFLEATKTARASDPLRSGQPVTAA